MEADIGFVGMGASALLVVVAVAVSVRQRLGVERDIVVAAVRAAVQLLAVGSVLALLLDPDTPLALAFAWLAVMLVFAVWTAARRASEVPGIEWLAFASFASATVVSLGVLFGLGVYDLTARTLIPLGGMVIGNSISATVLVGRRVIDEFVDKRDEIEARLALGASGPDATRPYLRAAIRTALIPQIETTKAVGIVFLPGAMVGLILAGAEPIDAVKVQAAVMYMILGAVATTTTVIAIGLGRRLVTPDLRLRRIDRHR